MPSRVSVRPRRVASLILLSHKGFAMTTPLFKIESGNGGAGVPTGLRGQPLGYTRIQVTCLVLGHLGGMVDFVVLPLWIGALMQSRGMNAQQAGLLVTLYIVGVFAGSMLIAGRLARLNARYTAVCGFLVGTLGFIGLIAAHQMTMMVAFHLLAGVGVGCGLSATHGAMARSGQPHRLFGLGSFVQAMFAIVFFAVVPGFLPRGGATLIFAILASLVLLPAIVASLAFPKLPPLPEIHRKTANCVPLRVRVLCFMGVACLTTTQAMIFGFAERFGSADGFTAKQIGLTLVISGFVNLTAPLTATALERVLPRLLVAIIAVPLHALFGALAVLSTGYFSYSLFLTAFVWLVIFGHIFIFGFLAHVDPSGRTAASTPAMIMVGSAVGPLLGGTLAHAYGYHALSPAAVVIGIAGSLCFILVALHYRSPRATVNAARALP